jgi:pimeloyl-ACP methyl ester carboxylesterase
LRLHLEVVPASGPAIAAGPLLIVHGLFGSADNWRTLAKAWAAGPVAPREVLAVDLRNHGRSPWSDEMTYPALAADLVELLDDRGLATVAVLGHSLGGKVAMTLALTAPHRVERLVVADIGPQAYPSSQEDVLAALQAVDPTSCGTRGEVDVRLAPAISDVGTRQFLLKSLERVDTGGFRWRLNLAALAAAAPALRQSVPDALAAAGVAVRPAADLPTLALRGARSRYLRDEDLPAMSGLFPRLEVATIADAGHWLHVDQPAAVAARVATFLAKSD